MGVGKRAGWIGEPSLFTSALGSVVTIKPPSRRAADESARRMAGLAPETRPRA